jgi:uncharacterized protein
MNPAAGRFDPAAAGMARVAITGASGLVGSALREALVAAGVEAVPMVRRKAGAGELGWNPAEGVIDRAGLATVDAVVHLAGENLAGGRWTEERKRRIRESRTRGTALVAGALAEIRGRPRVLVSASAIGYYGDRGDQLLTEDDPPGAGFLRDVVVAWEEATAPAAEAGVRVVSTRSGLVLSPRGGSLALMLPPFRLGLGGPLGSGEQWLSWVTLDDAVGVLLAALACEDLSGPVNVTAPGAVRNAEFTRALGQALGRPTVLRVPAAVLEGLLGELARETLLASTRVAPARLQALGFPFRDPAIEPALARLLG